MIKHESRARIDTYDNRLKSQGERIGKLETSAETQSVISTKHQGRLEALENDVDYLKTKGSRRWDGIIEKAACVIVGAIIMFVLYQFGL